MNRPELLDLAQELIRFSDEHLAEWPESSAPKLAVNELVVRITAPAMDSPVPGPDDETPASPAMWRLPADPQLPPLMCGPCITDARTAELLGRPPQEIHPAVTILGGTALCDVPGRHRIQVQPQGSGLVIAQPGMPGYN